MDFTDIDIDKLVSDLERKRKELNLTYQNIADSCGVSQTTIIRLFKRDGEPSFPTMQKVVSALQYDFASSPVISPEPSNDEYMQYLRELVDFERKDKKIRLEQQEARYNRLRNEQRRVIIVVIGICGLLTAFICGVLVYDIANPDRGWFREYMDSHGLMAHIVISVRSWLERLWI